MLHNLAFCIVGICLGAERDSGTIGFIVADHIFIKPSSWAYANRQNARCHGIERTGMANALLPHDATNAVDDIVRSEINGFADTDNQ